MKSVSFVCLVMTFGMCNTLWSMDKLDQDIVACKANIDRLNKERSDIRVKGSIRWDPKIQSYMAYSRELTKEHDRYESLMQQRLDLQKTLPKL